MRLLWQELSSRLQYKIVLPFLLLTLCVALLGSALAFRLIAGSWQERFDNQLAQTMRVANDGIIEQENTNLQFLRQVVGAQANPAADAPAVADAIAANNVDGLQRALVPFFYDGAKRSNVRLDRLIAFNREGKTLADFGHAQDSTPAKPTYVLHASINLSKTWFVPKILTSVSDEVGDKYAGLAQFNDFDNLNTNYFLTIAPVRQNGTVVGGIIVGMRIDTLLNRLLEQSQAGVLTIYQGNGTIFATTAMAVTELAQLDPADKLKAISPNTLDRIKTADTTSDQSIFDTVTVNTRSYQFAYTALRIRSATVGIFASGLTRDYVVGAWADSRMPVFGLTFALTVAIIGLGVYIARLITAPLEELVLTARAVTSGDLQRRSQVADSRPDEIGVLSNSFNSMTEHLLTLYHTVSTESSQRAAIVDSIVDGIVVCDEDGIILTINPATRKLLGLSDTDPQPYRFSDLPLVLNTEGGTGFDNQRAADLYTIGESYVRVSIAPVITEQQLRVGYVCVLQDMTAEVAMDRAKTNFIGTISHELRTPLTVIRGNSDLIARGMVGPITDEQRDLIETIRLHVGNMTGLLNNVIIIAGLDSGSLNIDFESVELRRVVDEAIWPVRSQIRAKSLTLNVEIPKDLPLVMADFSQLRNVLHQLLDNARRYTAQGGITIRATAEPEYVRVFVQDTGRGIPPELHEQIFQRFIRGDGADEGINSAERGIGLGLAIVKQLVERQGGAVQVESALGQGSTFSFTLRYADATPTPENQDEGLATAA